MNLVDTIRNLAVQTNANRRIVNRRTGTDQSWLIDMRPLFMTPEHLTALADAFWDKYNRYPPMQVATIATSAIPLLTAILLRAPKGRIVTGFIVRKERNTYGLGNSVEGIIQHLPVIAIDDLTNSGSSLERIRVVAEAHGCQVADVFVAVDFQSESGMHWREVNNIRVASITTAKELGMPIGRQNTPSNRRYTRLWEIKHEGANFHYVVPKSKPILVDNLIIQGCDVGKLIAVNKFTGKTVWEHLAKGAFNTRKGIFSTPIYSEGNLYYGAYNGSLYKLDAATGKQIWENRCCDWIGGSPIINGDLILIGMEYAKPQPSGALAAFDKNTGEQLWSVPTNTVQHGTAALLNSNLAIWGTNDSTVVATDMQGNVIWKQNVGGQIKQAPLIHNGFAYVPCLDGSLYQYSREGEQIKKYETNGLIWSTPISMKNRVVFGSTDTAIYSIGDDDIKNCHIRRAIIGSPAKFGDHILVGNAAGIVYEFDQDLNILGSFGVPDAVVNAPLVDGDVIYIPTAMNSLHAYRVS